MSHDKKWSAHYDIEHAINGHYKVRYTVDGKPPLYLIHLSYVGDWGTTPWQDTFYATIGEATTAAKNHAALMVDRAKIGTVALDLGRLP